VDSIGCRRGFGSPSKLCFTDFEIICDWGKARFCLYASRPFFFQDLHEHPLGASQLSVSHAPRRGLDALAASGFPTPDYRRQRSFRAIALHFVVSGSLNLLKRDRDILWNG
jgi:hypothetical protein